VYALLLLSLMHAAPQAPTAASPAAAVEVAHADAVALAARDVATHRDEARFHRYLWSNSKAKWFEDLKTSLYYHVHLLSDQAAYGTFVFPAANVIRLDMRDFGWDRKGKLAVWERSADIDPYFHAKKKLLADGYETIYWPGGVDTDGKNYARRSYEVHHKAGELFATASPLLPQKKIDDLRRILYTESPILNAEWFFVQTARQISLANQETGFGYYDFIGVKSRDDFFKLVGLDEKTAIKIFRELREVVTKSGVSQQNRQLLRLGGAAGGVWGTLDTFTQAGKGVAKLNLRRGEFQHDAEEWYGPNPLGLPYTLANDQNGKLASTVPDKIGAAKGPYVVGNDTRIHPNLCMVCHGPGSNNHLMDIDGWARKTFRAGRAKLQDPDKRVQLELQAQYLRDLKTEIEDDRRKYARAVATVTRSASKPNGLTVSEATKQYMGVFNRYAEDSLTLDDAARELGVAPRRLVQALTAYEAKKGRTELVLSEFMDSPPGKISRLDWEAVYQFVGTLAAGVAPAEILENRKVGKGKVNP
jgi:hypothetical protein